VVEARIDSIAGHAIDLDAPSLWFLITYSDGDEEYREGTMQDVSDLATASGLSVFPARSQSFRWARTPVS
jgi:hypothetical protein